ncbi:MAG: hypothetical protein IKK34_06995 [Clostridia bacterium]|nr:hypothetical protein [Clostridia bacterium]
MKDDLVSRQWLLNEYDRQHKGPPGGARKIMEEAPAVDAEPVRHGRWIRMDDTFARWQCSACGAKNHSVCWTYCPSCGAKMDGGTRDVE